MYAKQRFVLDKVEKHSFRKRRHPQLSNEIVFDKRLPDFCRASYEVPGEWVRI